MHGVLEDQLRATEDAVKMVKELLQAAIILVQGTE